MANYLNRPSIFEIATAYDNGKKEELFRFFDNYGKNGIKINVEPHFEDLYK